MIGSMQLIMNDENLKTMEQVKGFLEGSEGLEFKGLSVEDKYQWTEATLLKFRYYRVKRGAKGVIRRYIERMTGYSRAQVCRLIGQYNRTGEVQRRTYRRHRFPVKYTPGDIELLASVVSHKTVYNSCHSGLDPESRFSFWIPACAGMTSVVTVSS